jgi:Xaa-Pro aminopeptidase
MSTVFSGQSGALSSGEFRIGDIERLEEIERKHRTVGQYLEETGSDALLLQRPANFAWFTTGSDNSRGESTEVGAALFITREARVVITSNVDSAQLFERDLPRLGFQLKERPWHEPRQTLIDDICRGRLVTGDTLSTSTTDVIERLLAMRLPLSEFECRRVRELGKIVAHAVEATARTCARGATEAEIAGEAAHRLIRHQVLPERIQAWSEDRAARYPHGRFGNQPVEHYGTISIVGRRWGLHAAATRTFCFGKPPEELRDDYFRATLAQTTGMYFSHPNWDLAEVWERVRRIYEKYGCPDVWQNADQAEIIGYEAAEVPLVPRSTFRLEQRLPIFWHPLVGSAIVGDTVLTGESGFNVVTGMEEWPKLKVQVKKTRIERPDILQRPE